MCNRLIHSVQSLRQSTKAFPDNRPMGFRFRRSFSILPGIRLNLGKRGISASIGVRGAHVTFGPTGTRTTVGLPRCGKTQAGRDITAEMSRRLRSTTP
jgi:hypothetical protein